MQHPLLGPAHIGAWEVRPPLPRLPFLPRLTHTRRCPCWAYAWAGRWMPSRGLRQAEVPTSPLLFDARYAKAPLRGSTSGPQQRWSVLGAQRWLRSEDRARSPARGQQGLRVQPPTGALHGRRTGHPPMPLGVDYRSPGSSTSKLITSITIAPTMNPRTWLPRVTRATRAARLIVVGTDRTQLADARTAD